MLEINVEIEQEQNVHLQYPRIQIGIYSTITQQWMLPSTE